MDVVRATPAADPDPDVGARAGEEARPEVPLKDPSARLAIRREMDAWVTSCAIWRWRRWAVESCGCCRRG